MSESCLQHIEDSWKEKTKTANQLFNDGKFKEALTGYQEALYRAEVLNNFQSEAICIGIPFIQVFAISCNNIAFTYEELKEPKKGIKILERVIYYLLHLSKNDNLNPSEIQNELKRATLTYQEFLGRSGLELENKRSIITDIKKEF